jgi:2-polyprenyl-3-methyl-5-hydroxy-6-metoxy-1,4-benzoquinol methylase
MVIARSSSDYLQAYWSDAFDLHSHLLEFLQLTPQTLEAKLASSQADLAQMGRRDFDWEQAQQFYQDQVGELHILDLAAWHLSSRDYIGDTLRLVDQFACGRVLDFGGGIGTHTLAAAMNPRVQSVIFWDLNPLHRDFVNLRAQHLGLDTKVICPSQLPEFPTYDTIICLDVLEHLSDPAAQLQHFHRLLSPQGKIILNWYFFKGFQQEFPFHQDDPALIKQFFLCLQTLFMEVFHPYLITTRCYEKIAPV